MSVTGWLPDLLEGFERRDLPLSALPLEGEPEGPMVATLVRRTRQADPARDERRRAVLYVHGWNDYFFHTHVADFFESRGVTLYALDLRRYGRSFREGQYANYVADLGDYAEEFDLAVREVASRHASVSIMAHSTGGLAAALWASGTGRGRVAGLILNSPWLDLWGPPALAGVLAPLMGGLSRRNPLNVLRVPDSRGLYVKSLHSTERGEWRFDLALKSAIPVPVRVGWARSILQAHAAVAAGLDIRCPVLMGCSAKSSVLSGWAETATNTDIVLDVDKIAARAPKLGQCVTLVRIEGGVHDLTLSAKPARERFFSEISRWLDAYVPEPDGD